MFKKDQLIELLEKIGKEVKTEITVYLIGGCNLSLKDIKAATKDIDMVLTSMNEFGILKSAIIEAGLKETIDNPDEAVYRDALVVFKGTDESRIDVFVETIAQKLKLTKRMIDRTDFYRAYGKMKVYLVSNDDVFLFKSVTERDADLEDLNRLFTREPKWKTIIEECTLQNREGAHWIFWLFEQVCKLERKFQLTVRQRPRILKICREDWNNKPDDWMVDFTDGEIRKLIPGKESQEVISSVKKYRK